jgi:hypothetical protein
MRHVGVQGKDDMFAVNGVHYLPKVCYFSADNYDEEE